MDAEHFECDICCERYDESGAHVPLVLPCGHTLCKQCVESLRARSCPTCKSPLTNSESATAVMLPRNNWLIRCLVASQSQSSSQVQVAPRSTPRKRLAPNAPKVAAVGQRVLFKQLDRACGGSGSLQCSGAVTSPSLSREQQHDLLRRDRAFLLNLARVCKEKKAQDSNFDQKRFVKEGLIMKFGEAKAKTIIHQVFDRMKVLRDKKLSAAV